MASSSYHSRGSRGKEVAVERNASPSGWISVTVLPEKGLSTFIEMKGDCYPNLVNVFYNNLKVVNGDIHSHVKGVDIVINNDTWLQVAGLKDEGCMSHLPDSLHNRWLDKEEKIIAYIIDWLLVPGRFHYDKLTSEDLYLLNAIVLRIQTNWVFVFKKHIIDTGINNWYNLPYGVFISKILSLSQIDFTSEIKITCNITNEIEKPTLTCICLKKTVLGWIFSDVQTTTKDKDEVFESDSEQISVSPKSEFEKIVVNKFEKSSKRVVKLKKSLMRMTQKMDEIIKNYVESSTSTEKSTYENDVSSEENSMEISVSE
ncbi:hypothetical protein LR48_Vigan10g193900 [Vigna angularis]|uniref:Uncharacterized protein n=1 Tax=Phaseolus angularis TaxID=3914 RepID=A0A0L9VME4_PHAAN|nr:hypothetical protein LR48_Vigan10g193900 [Vigna angularis]